MTSVGMCPEHSNPQWERVLWKSKPYPDNYVPASFLSSLTQNCELHPRKLPLFPAQSTHISSSQLPAIYLLVTVGRIVDDQSTSRRNFYLSRRLRQRARAAGPGAASPLPRAHARGHRVLRAAADAAASGRTALLSRSRRVITERH